MRSSSKPAVFTGDAIPALFQQSPARWAPDDLSHATFDTLADRRDARQEAAQIDAAEADAAREREIELRVQEAFAAGHEEGRIEGEIAEGLRLRNAVAAAEAALETVRENEARWQHAVAENVTALAIAVARQIVGRELRNDAPAMAELVKRALAEFPIDQPMRIRVNPTDLSVLSMHTTPAGEPVTIAPNRDIRWMADARIQPGGCIVEGRERIVDGRVDTALERMYRRLSDSNV